MGRFIKLMFVLALATAVAAGCNRKSKGGSQRMGKNTGATNGSGPTNPEDIPKVPKNGPDGEGQSKATEGNKGVTTPIPPPRGGQNLPEPGYGYEGDGEDGETVDTDFSGGAFTMLGEAQQCGEAFKVRESVWYPGILYPPAQEPIITGGISARGFQFSDSHDDSVMENLQYSFEKLIEKNKLECIREPSKELASRISNVDVYTDIYRTGEIRATIELNDGSILTREKGIKSEKQRILINLTGAIGGKMNANRTYIPMVQTNAARGGVQFEAFAHCLDADRGCQTVAIQLMQLNEQGKRNRLAPNRYCRIAYIVQRFGNAHVTISEEDRRFGHVLNNSQRSRLAQYLGNTVRANCLKTLDQIRTGNRGQVPMCAIQRLENQCGDDVKREPFAREIGIKTWSVLFGAAKFHIYMDDVLTLDGPLVSAPIRPVFDGKLRVGGQSAAGIESAFLINNDGAGQMNFELNFQGGGMSQMRFSVTSILKDSALGQQTDTFIDVFSGKEFVVTRDQIDPLAGSAYEPSDEYPAPGSVVGEEVANSTDAILSGGDQRHQQQTKTETVVDGDDEVQANKEYKAPEVKRKQTSDIRAATTDHQDK